MTSETPRWDEGDIEALRAKIALKKEEIAARPAHAGLIPLRIICKMSSCRHGRHCLDYLRTPHAHAVAAQPGACRDCGAPVVDLPVAFSSDATVEQLATTCLAQQNELIRAHYWHVPIDLWAYNKALRLGRRELYRRATQKVELALITNDAFSARRTSYDGDVISYAQHAVAACCRKCAHYWHGLPLQEAPNSRQLAHLTSLVRLYLDCRLPDLPDEALPRSIVSPITSALLPDEAAIALEDDRIRLELRRGADPAGMLAPKGTGLKLVAARGVAGGYIGVADHQPQLDFHVVGARRTG
jgi:hypothetical protein